MMRGLKRCVIAPKTFQAPSCQRWRSYDQNQLSKEALLQQAESGLGVDVEGKPMRIDAETKTISTAAGSLPISPVFDPNWMASRRRKKKAAPTALVGRSRKKLGLNPFARALATPIRTCSVTNTSLPRHFLQDFEVIANPKTNEPWYVPGQAAFHRVKPKYWDKENHGEALETSGFTKNNIANNDGLNASKMDTGSEANEKLGVAGEEYPEQRGRAPITVYALSKKPLLDTFGQMKPKLMKRLLGGRSGTAMSEAMRAATFRRDTADVLLGMLRRTTVDALITRANRTQGLDMFVQPVKSWSEVGDVKRRGCVLWLRQDAQDAGRQASGSSAYATVDVEAAYDRKMPVHDLMWLLGSEEVARLKAAAPIFADNEILVLKTWKTHSMVNLHLILWRLQGYLADS